MNFSNPILMAARSLVGNLRLLRSVVQVFRYFTSYKYEKNFDAALMTSIRAQDTVWDVGANIGYYTSKFAESAKSGLIVAFEPSPSTFPLLQEKFRHTSNVHIENVALGDDEGDKSFFIAKSSVEDSLFNRSGVYATEVKVRVARADSYAESFPPNVIKIDVEGFELEVLNGMHKTLLSPSLRYVFVEVHFSVLVERGHPRAPRDIVQCLTNAGFLTKWLDSSHLAARRQ